MGSGVLRLAMRAFALLALLVLSAPPAGAAVPNGCTFLPGAYACVAEEQDDCGGFTAVGAGLTGLAGASAGGIDSCGADYALASASVGVVYVNVVWVESGDACFVVASTPAGAVSQDCPAGTPPPNPGWGRLLA